MKIKYYLFLLCFSSSIIIMSCNNPETYGNDETENIKSTADDFSYNFFNYRFEKAMRLCTTETKQYISYIATNITEEDIDNLHKKETAAKCEAEDITLLNDSCAEICCTVTDYYAKDVIGEAGRTINRSEYIIMLVKDNGKWLVKKVSRQQNGKPSRD